MRKVGMGPFGGQRLSWLEAPIAQVSDGISVADEYGVMWEDVLRLRLVSAVSNSGNGCGISDDLFVGHVKDYLMPLALLVQASVRPDESCKPALVGCPFGEQVGPGLRPSTGRVLAGTGQRAVVAGLADDRGEVIAATFARFDLAAEAVTSAGRTGSVVPPRPVDLFDPVGFCLDVHGVSLAEIRSEDTP